MWSTPSLNSSPRTRHRESKKLGTCPGRFPSLFWLCLVSDDSFLYSVCMYMKHSIAAQRSSLPHGHLVRFNDHRRGRADHGTYPWFPQRGRQQEAFQVCVRAVSIDNTRNLHIAFCGVIHINQGTFCCDVPVRSLPPLPLPFFFSPLSFSHSILPRLESGRIIRKYKQLLSVCIPSNIDLSDRPSLRSVIGTPYTPGASAASRRWNLLKASGSSAV